MANTRAKGARKEKKVCEILEAEGFLTVRPHYSPYGYTDFFNLWDIIAVRHDEIRFIQVKSRKSHTYGKALDAHRAFECPPNTKKECWLMEDRKDPIIITL